MVYQKFMMIAWLAIRKFLLEQRACDKMAGGAVGVLRRVSFCIRSQLYKVDKPVGACLRCEGEAFSVSGVRIRAWKTIDPGSKSRSEGLLEAAMGKVRSQTSEYGSYITRHAHLGTPRGACFPTTFLYFS